MLFYRTLPASRVRVCVCAWVCVVSDSVRTHVGGDFRRASRRLSSGDGEAGDGLGMVVQGTRGGFGGMRISAYQTDPKVRAKVREAPRCSVPSVAQRSLPAPPRVSAPCRDPFRLGWEQARENVPRGEGGGLSGFLLRLP